MREHLGEEEGWDIIIYVILIMNSFIAWTHTDGKARRDTHASEAIPEGLIHKVPLLDMEQALAVWL